MRETTFDITNWKSVLDAQCIEHCLKAHPGVLHAEANFMSGTVTVHYDESNVSLADLKMWLERGDLVSGRVVARASQARQSRRGHDNGARGTRHANRCAHSAP